VVLETAILRPVTAIIAGQVATAERQPDWVDDFPSEGDIVICGLIQQSLAAGATYEPPTVIAPWTGPWQICVRDEQQVRVVGTVGFKSGPTPHNTLEIGYGIVASARGRSVASSAVRALLELVAGHGVRIIAETEPGNVASERVLTACGFLVTHVAHNGNTWWELD